MKACNWRALHRKLEEKKVKKLITKKHTFKKSAASITRQHFMKTIVKFYISKQKYRIKYRIFIPIFEYICRFVFIICCCPEKDNQIGSVVIEILRYTQLDRHPPILYEFNMYCGIE